MVGRYLIFMGDSYYARGGWSDYVGSSPTLSDAISTAVKGVEECTIGWWHVVDTETGKIVHGLEGKYCGDLPEGITEAPK